MKNSDLLRWADKFLNRGLKPKDINISYQYFCSLFFPNFRKESYKRTVYNFYKIWDGRSYSDIINRHPKANILKDFSYVETKIVLDYLTTKVEFFNQKTGEKISNPHELHSLFYSQTNKVFFVQNDDNDFYSARKNKIDFGTDFIIVSAEEINGIDSFLDNEFRQEFGNDFLYIYVVKFSKGACVKLNIETGQKAPLELVGGLKKSRNCYYNFGIPVIEFSQPQKIIYINSNMVNIDSDRVILSELPCLESIKKKGGSVLIHFSDYLPVDFTVECIDSEKNIPDLIGWEFDDNRYVPLSVEKEEISKAAIIGFNSTIDFKPMVLDNRRKFIVRNEYLEKRFLKIKDF